MNTVQSYSNLVDCATAPFETWAIDAPGYLGPFTATESVFIVSEVSRLLDAIPARQYAENLRHCVLDLSRAESELLHTPDFLNSMLLLMESFNRIDCIETIRKGGANGN